MSEAYAPNGARIIGTAETLPGVAYIKPTSFRIDSDGHLKFEYEGETDVGWDSQESEFHYGETVFIDENWDSWRESEITVDGSRPRSSPWLEKVTFYDADGNLIHTVEDVPVDMRWGVIWFVSNRLLPGKVDRVRWEQMS